ncbi:hypothetical protein QFC21_001535 [Naganishia friedmannii]|uniref:Uncharacterized protein n=1 Tax=Naganishia friedmannii TaxID=89922 RepID=A0ACC2W3S2_9TREE|nr:hypothetical protein QFC21_001535 [Naganishia friedmannii]
MQTETPPVTQEGPDFDLSKIEYVKGFNDPSANVVFICSDKKALRIHDYYLKASRRPAYSLLSQIAAQNSNDPRNDIKSLIRLHAVADKYIFGSVGTFVKGLIVQYASDHPPLALSFAVNLQIPDEAIIRAALDNFSSAMPSSVADALTRALPRPHYRGSPTTGPLYYSPAADSLSRKYIHGLGLDAYHAYVVALKAGYAGDEQWSWKVVADSFVKHLNIPNVKGGIGMLVV